MRETEELGQGPWSNEPDRVEFRHAGLPCLIVRGPMGNLCGYAAVPPGHPWHGKGYDERDVDVEVHGGLTFADKCHEGGHICHVPKHGEPDDVWWFGFACGHAGDLVPRIEATLRLLPGPPWDYQGLGLVYRDVTYVKEEVTRLAEQLQRAAAM